MKDSNEEGHGTANQLHLPPSRVTQEIVNQESLTHDIAAPPVAPVLSGNETILVVEDDPLVLDLVVAQLRSLGYMTIAAADGPKALALIEQGATFDLLFTDVIMPNGINGFELSSEVAKRCPGTKVLFTSGYTDNAMSDHGRLDEGVLLLSKPYRRSQLAHMVRVALGDATLVVAG
jgi:CheY-like chemotaxis protein